MIEIGASPSEDQVRQLFQETTSLLTMLSHPDLHDLDDRARQANATFATSPPYALVVLASIGAGRYWRLRQLGPDGGGRVPYPRDVLQTVPSGGRPDLLLLAIDLVETVAQGGHVRPVVDQMLESGARAYDLLLHVVHEMGWLAARADPSIKNLVDLVAVEALTAELDWYEHQGRR